MIDEQIIGLLYVRDERGLDELRSAYGTIALNLAQRITGFAESAEECVQDGLLDAWNSIPPECPESLKFYFLRLVRNRALDSLRYQHRAKRGSGEMPLIFDELTFDVPSSSSIEDELAEKVLMEKINEFLGTLSKRDRDVFLRRYYYIDSPETIATCLNLSKTNVSVILFRTRKKLKKYLIKEALL